MAVRFDRSNLSIVTDEIKTRRTFEATVEDIGEVFSQLPYSVVAIFKNKLDENSKEEHGQLAIVANVPSASFLLQSLHSIARIIYEATEEADKNMIPQIERELFDAVAYKSDNFDSEVVKRK